MISQGTLDSNQHSLRKNRSPRNWKCRSEGYFLLSERDWRLPPFLFPLLVCSTLRPAVSVSGCSWLPCSAWQWLSVQIQPRLTGVSALRPNSRFPAGRIWLLQPKAGRHSDEVWEVGSHYYCLLRRSHRSKIPQSGTCRGSLKRVPGQSENNGKSKWLWSLARGRSQIKARKSTSGVSGGWRRSSVFPLLLHAPIGDVHSPATTSSHGELVYYLFPDG